MRAQDTLLCLVVTISTMPCDKAKKRAAAANADRRASVIQENDNDVLQPITPFGMPRLRQSDLV